MKPSKLLAQLGRAVVLMTMTAFVLGPMMVTFLGGFKSSGDLRINPFGLPKVWQTEYLLRSSATPDFGPISAIRSLSRW